MFGINSGELILIVLLAILLLGPKNLPQVVKTIARAYQLLLRWKTEIEEQLRDIREEMEKVVVDEELSVADVGKEARREDDELDDYLAASQKDIKDESGCSEKYESNRRTMNNSYSYKEYVGEEVVDEGE